MGRRVKAVLGILVVALVGVQAIRPERTNPPVESELPAPPEIKTLLRRACYDCHSHETVWPWYSVVAPVSWLVAHDVQEGREDLDYSTWGAYGPVKRAKKLRETANVVTQAEMPPRLYRIAHPAARLSDAERQAIAAWCADELAHIGR